MLQNKYITSINDTENDSCISGSHLPPGSILFLVFHEEGQDGYLVISFVAVFCVCLFCGEGKGACLPLF